MLITSPQNSRIKAIQALEKPRERRAAGLFRIEGLKELEHALAAGYQIDTLVYCPDISGGLDPKLPGHAREQIEVTKEVFSKLAVREDSGGILATAHMRSHGLESLRLSACPLVLVLESVEKPGNLGALLRTADAAGLDAVIVCDAQTDVYNPNVIRSSVGCLFSVPVAIASCSETIAWLRSNKISIHATHLKASVPYDRVDYRRPCAIIMGTEATGLSEAWWSASDANIIIPMRGKNDSMNVSTAAAVVVFEAVRQRNTHE